MRYMDLQSKGLVIGSGVVEAACKTLVTQRLKQSGMRWSVSGAQAILTPRGWDQSDRFDAAWALIAATFEVDVTVLANVIALAPAGAKNAAREGVTMRTPPCRYKCSRRRLRKVRRQKSCTLDICPQNGA